MRIEKVCVRIEGRSEVCGEGVLATAVRSGSLQQRYMAACVCERVQRAVWFVSLQCPGDEMGAAGWTVVVLSYMRALKKGDEGLSDL